ncbi:unnamed protein product [Periconia digitata]|uniref:NACHT domain-containing protein n=1 Tax=Periconia digitata TaxID=1303443 RepID=A0A9W4XMG9_9PLEO|nr:unnamed protein product [Periconia digitata]
MASSSSVPDESFRSRISLRLRRLRHKLQHHPSNNSVQSAQAVNPDSGNSQNIVDSQLSYQTFGPSTELDVSRNDETRTPNDAVRSIAPPSDLWSAAYREAVDGLRKETDFVIDIDSNAAELFEKLEEFDKDATQESAFLRGVAYLRSIQVPLERFKLALDLASPWANLDPTAKTVFTVVSGVTAVAITFATADLAFAEQIGEMLEQISYIDDCDTLGQRGNRADIHKALVSVYKKILEFYEAAHDILTRRGGKLAMKMILETDRLPHIIQDFLKQAELLRKLIEKATWEIVEDIKAMLYDREIARWLGSDKVNLQSQYHVHLQDLRSDSACKFLLSHPSFMDWYRATGSRQLLILGEMGCGKSVLMSFLVDELHRRNEHQLPRPKVCYHYCRNDGTGKPVYILSSLILALLEQLSGLKKSFYEWYKENQSLGIVDPATSIPKLEEFLIQVLEILDRPIFITIDGLDECDRTSRKILLELSNTLLRKAPRLSIVFSSRLDEETLQQMDRTPTIVMSSDIHRDRVIVQHTVEKRLDYLSADVASLIIQSLSRMAQGSAIWTKMIVELIEIRKIRAHGPMKRFLEGLPLPQHLSNIYTTLLERSSADDTDNQAIAIGALKILAIACRPLSIQELAWAVALATVQHDVTTVAALAQLVDPQRVVSLIHPFIMRIDFVDVKKRQVQLVHQSVKEYIIEESWRHGGSITTRAPNQTENHQNERLEQFILELCIRYLCLDEIGRSRLFSDEQIAIDQLPEDFDLFSDDSSVNYDNYCTWEVWEENMIRYDPTERGFGEFFVYASSHWLKHLGAVKSGPITYLMNIENLCEAGSIRLDNWINQSCRPNCTIKARFDFDSRLYDPLSITSLYGSNIVLHDLLENSSFDKNKYLASPAIGAADQVLQWGDLSRLRTLLNSEIGYQIKNLDFFCLVIERWSQLNSRHDDWEVAFDLIDSVQDLLVEEKWGHQLLNFAARIGCMPMIQRLLRRAQDHMEVEGELCNSQPITEAVLGNHVDVVRYFMNEGMFRASIHRTDRESANILHLASGRCNPDILRLLAPVFQNDMGQTDIYGDTALTRVIRNKSNSQDRHDAAKVLLAYMDPEKDNYAQPNPLRIAVELGDVEMCQLLICEGRMDPFSVLTRNQDGDPTMKYKPLKEEKALQKLLQEHAALTSTLRQDT